MPQLVKCPQQHIWSPAHSEASDATLICPVCGEAGAPTGVEAIDESAFGGTLDPTWTPPIVEGVKTFVPRAGRDADGSAPTVPGYDIIRELGRGGMGVVYLAQHHELKRLVALKMILAGAHADPQTLIRFRREAEAVARLQHHGIVQIHDVGECEGRPFLALEYVDGNNLANQFAEALLAPNVAASLVESLASTIHYAHRRGIVHRDLTPRNVLLAVGDAGVGIRLVTGDGKVYQPKITDFGLAQELDGDVRQTQTGVIMGTPSYMSPEQAQGRTHDIGAPADIHALGAILYEALTGRPPFLAESSFETLVQVIEHEPVPPMRLQPGVPRDLETICLKCLAKDPQKRYPTAEALADDLHRFLAGEPIVARPVSWQERAWKWVRRYPTAAALIGVVIFAACAFTLGGIAYNIRVRTERDQNEQSLNLAMQAIDRMLTEVGEQQLAVEPRMEEKRQVLLQEALVLYQELLAKRIDDPRMRLETARAHRRLADVLRLLGQHAESIKAYDNALVLFELLQEQTPGDTVSRDEIAYCQNMRGEALRSTSRRDEAEVAYAHAQRLLETLADENPDEASYWQDLARTFYNRGILFGETNRESDAEREYQRAVELLSELLARITGTPEQRQHLARAYLNLGTVIPEDDRFDDAKSAYDRAIEILLELSDEFPDSPDYRYELGVAFNNLGNLLGRVGRSTDAIAAYAQSHERFAALSRDFPKVPVYRQELANSFNSIGSISASEKDHVGAVKAWEQAATLLEGLVLEHKDQVAYQGDLGMVRGNLGLAHYSLSQLPQARSHLEKAIDGLRLSLAAHPDEAPLKNVLRDSYQNLAEVLVASHDHAAAARAARALPEVFPNEGRDRYVAACYLSRCAKEAGGDTKLEAAEREALSQKYCDEAVAALKQAIERGFRDVDQIEKDRDHALKSIAGRPEFEELVAGLRRVANG